MNEWKSCFFFPAMEKNKTTSKSIEWMARELFFRKKKIQPKTKKMAEPKGIVFFFYTEKFVFVHFWGISNEWMKKLFFFSRVVFFFSAQKFEWMNGLWTFPGKEKTQKNAPKFRKKKTQPTFIKNNRSPSKIRMNDRWTFPGKKKQLVFFFLRFFPLRGKKKTRFSDLNEWMTNVHARRKKNTIPLMGHLFTCGLSWNQKL